VSTGETRSPELGWATGCTSEGEELGLSRTSSSRRTERAIERQIGAREGVVMEIDKDTVLSLLRERGQDQEAARAEEELPSKVDTERDAGLLQKFGVDPEELLSRFTGGADIPGL
jgi:hypothetical protein